VNDHIKVLEKRYCSFLLNCMPNNKGLFDANILATLRAVGPMWTPDLTRPALPAQPDILLYPVTPVSATATSGVAANAIDGKVDWAQFARETWWESSGSLPQSVTMDLGAVWSNIDAVGYLPRQDRATVSAPQVTTGNITGYRVYTSTNGTAFTQVASGTWAGTKALKYARFPAVNARYVRLEATATVGGGPAIINELDCGGIAARPVKDGTTTPPASAVKLVNRRTGKVIGANANATGTAPVVQQTDTGSAFQQWQLVDAGSGYTKLVNRGSGLLLDVTGKSLLDGAAVVQYRDVGSANQQWLVATSGGYSKLTNRNSGKVLDLTGGSATDGTAVVQWTDNGGTNPQWTLVPV
jgi:alpha-L-fucosidase